MSSKKYHSVVHIFGALLLATAYAFPAQAHNGEDAHSAPAVPQANVPMELVAGAVVRMVVENRVTNVTTQYIALRGDDGKRVVLNGNALDALQNGAHAEAIGWHSGSTFTVSDFRTVVAAKEQTTNTQPTPVLQVEGTLLLAHLDFLDSGRGEYLYMLRDDAGHVTRLNLASGDGIQPGTRVSAHGTLSADGKSIDVDVLTIIAAPAPKPITQGQPVAQAATNNVLVILLKFTDSQATTFTQAQVQDTMTNATTGVARYYNEVSYGQQSLNVTVTNWLVGEDASHAPAATPPSCDFDTMGTYGDTAATDAGFVLGNYQNKFYVMPQNPACGFSGVAYIGGDTAWSNGINDIKVYAHELGHNFGLFHAASLTCASASIGVSIGGTCTSSEYGDPFDVMGNISSMHFNTTQKSKLAWISASTVKTQGSGFHQYTLDALEIGGGTTYAVTIPTANANRTYWIEYRQPLGFDTGLPTANANGAQIRVANPFETCTGCQFFLGMNVSDDTELLDMTASGTPGNFNDARLAVGSTFTDSTYGITVTVVSANLTQLVLNVTTPSGSSTTTTLVSSLNPSTSGNNVTFTASVTGSAPTGTVNFTDGGTTIAGCGTVALTGSGNTRTAACSTTALTAGTHNIVAAYAGDSANALSSSSPLSQVVNAKPATTTSIVSSLNPSTFGASVTFTASVTGTAPTGPVNFTDGGTTIAGCGAVALGGAGNTRTAACSTSALSATTHNIVAAYAGDAANAASSSTTLSQVVNKVSSATGLVSSANPANAGVNVSFTATVTGASPTGSVAFKEGGIALTGCSAVALSGAGNSRTAACSSSALSVGSHSIVATYGGDTNNAVSVSGALLQGTRTASGNANVALASAGGVATASSTSIQGGTFPASSVIDNERAGVNWGSGGGWQDSTSNVYPDWVEIDFGGLKSIERVIVYTVQDNFAAPVEPYDALTFATYGVTDFAVQGWNGSAWIALSTVAGNNLVKRSVAITPYTTDRIRINVTGALMLFSRITEVEAYGMAVAQTVSTTTLASSPNPSTLGSSVTFTATVSGTTPTGTVAFTDGGGAIAGCTAVSLVGSGNAPTANCTTGALTAGTHSIVATYAGNPANAASSSSPLSQVVNPASTTTSIFSSANPIIVGSSVMFSAFVTGNAPTGAVNFTDGGTTIGSCGAVALTGSGNTRTATCSTSALGAGTHTIVAAYAGDAGNAASSSAPLSQVVNNPGSTTTLSSSPNPSTAGTNLTFTATVIGNAPTGTLNFLDGGITISGCGAVAVTGAGNTRTAACSTSSLSPGVHSIIASYSGDGVNTASSSGPLTQTVSGPAPVMTSASSRKVHGSAGTFDLPLSAVPTNPTTEPRQGPAQSLVFTFDKPITDATVTVSEGIAVAAAPTFSGNTVIVSLTSVTNRQYVTVALSDVASADGGTGGAGSVRIGYLAGDVNQNRVVSVADVALVNAVLAQTVTASNYLKDINASGSLTVADKALANANLATGLPAP